MTPAEVRALVLDGLDAPELLAATAEQCARCGQRIQPCKCQRPSRQAFERVMAECRAALDRARRGRNERAEEDA